jgi:hypothetical protein
VYACDQDGVVDRVLLWVAVAHPVKEFETVTGSRLSSPRNASARRPPYAHLTGWISVDGGGRQAGDNPENPSRSGRRWIAVDRAEPFVHNGRPHGPDPRIQRITRNIFSRWAGG